MDWQTFLNSTAGLVTCAFILDLATGDPRWLPHPVVLMGKFIAYVESAMHTGIVRRDFLAGTTLSLLVIALSFVGAWSLVGLFRMLPFWAYFISIAALASTTLATRGLLDAVKRIEAPLVAGNVAAARHKLSHIVGRETSNLIKTRCCAPLWSLWLRAPAMASSRRFFIFSWAGSRWPWPIKRLVLSTR